MVSKTRDKLIEVAKQLFANKGVENTTMNDIAAASEKGRRTIYTYFKNKREIYNAVVESQSTAIISILKEISESDLPHPERLRKYLLKRINVMSEIIPQSKRPYDRYRMLFSRDYKRSEKIFDLARKKEQELFRAMLDSGVKSGEFRKEQADFLPSVMLVMYQTTDQMHIAASSDFEAEATKICEDIVDFVTNGIVVK